MRLVYDVESNGFIDVLTKLHCLAVMDVDTGEQTLYGPDEIDAGLNHLMNASELIAHNQTAFDLPAIRKLYPNFNTDGITVTDTLVLSRLIRADLKNEDFNQGWTNDRMPKRLYGSHSLKAWGIRLSVLKGDFGETTDWSEYTPEMGQYCLQDVMVCHKLWEALAPHEWSQQSIELEHSLAEICYRIGRAGWTFDRDKAVALYAQLAKERSDLEQELQELFPPWMVETPFWPKVNNQKLGYKKGEMFIKTREVQFNPNSRVHIEHCLRDKYSWKPKVFTANGAAKIDEAVLQALPFPEAQKLAYSFLLAKRIGALSEGSNAWLKLADGKKLRHVINSNGTVTGRASHFNPNLAQVPATGAPFGKQCRELFTVETGYVLIGTDLSGLELRCLAHYLQDNGSYAREVIEGDVHTANMRAAGLPDRPSAKRFVYAWLYGAGDAKIGEIVGAGAAEGRKLKEKFLRANPALASLLRAVKSAVQTRGHLLGLDGRKLYIRSEHAALNTLLQSAGALICKKWVELIDHEINQRQLPAEITGWIHDECQLSVKKGHEDVITDIVRRSATAAGEYWKFRVPIAADATVGRTWADTH